MLVNIVRIHSHYTLIMDPCLLGQIILLFCKVYWFLFKNLTNEAKSTNMKGAITEHPTFLSFLHILIINYKLRYYANVDVDHLFSHVLCSMVEEEEGGGRHCKNHQTLLPHTNYLKYFNIG